MFSPPNTIVLRCFSCTYSWPKRGCKTHQCFYYGMSLRPRGACSRPQKGAITHQKDLERETKGDVTSATYHSTLRSCIVRRDVVCILEAFPSSWVQENTPHTETLKRNVTCSLTRTTPSHKTLEHRGREARGGTVAGRNVIMYMPQSFQRQCYLGHLRSACNGVSTKSYISKYVMKRCEHVIKRKVLMEDQLHKLTRSYSTGHPLRREEEDADVEKNMKMEGQGKGVTEGAEHKPLPLPEISDSSPTASQPDIRQPLLPPTSSSLDIIKSSPQTPVPTIEEPPPPSPPPDTSRPASSPDTTTDIKPLTTAALGSDQLPSRFQRYIVWRYTWYLHRFQNSLRNEMPDTFNMFRIFTVGVKEFVIDFKDLVTILVQLSLPGFTLASLSRHELEVYYRMPGEMVRVFPILLLSSLPFGQNIAFPIGYWFPRHLLSHHFWDIQQRHEFAVQGLKSRLFNARPVFRSLQAAVLIMNDEDKEMCRNVFFKLGSGIHPSVEEIVALIPLFQGEPFHIRKIGLTHVNALLRFHGRSVLPWRRQRLKDHARILHCMDAAISREGVDSLTHDNLKNTLVFRGLNPTNMSTAAMVEYLQNWLTVSQEVDASAYSLLLHLPIFLAYNQPTNFTLLYS